MSKISASTAGTVDDSIAESAWFEHATIETDDGTTECTIFPIDCSDGELLTRWVTAQSGSFVPVEEMR